MLSNNAAVKLHCKSAFQSTHLIGYVYVYTPKFKMCLHKYYNVLQEEKTEQLTHGDRLWACNVFFYFTVSLKSSSQSHPRHYKNSFHRVNNTPCKLCPFKLTIWSIYNEMMNHIYLSVRHSSCSTNFSMHTIDVQLYHQKQWTFLP